MFSAQTCGKSAARFVRCNEMTSSGTICQRDAEGRRERPVGNECEAGLHRLFSLGANLFRYRVPQAEAAMNSLSTEEVLEQEAKQIGTARRLRLEKEEHGREAKKTLIGLAFSGGGIRSATFNLGVLQALAKKKLLRKFDYISTVSGGGYIGGWLMAWMHHQRIGIHDIEERLTASPLSPEESADPPEIHFLREYSNYLTPRKGVTGADFWAFAASYLRNTLLNQIILVLALLSLLLGPRTIVFLLHALEDLEERTEGNFFEILQPYMESQYFALALALILGFVAVTFMGLNLVTVDPHLTKRDYWFARQWAIHTFIVVPLLLSSALFTYGFSQFVTQWGILENAKYRAPLMGLFLYCGMWTGACVIRRIVRGRMGASGNGGPMGWLVVTTAAITGAIIGYLFLPFAKILIPAGAVAGETYSKWHIMTFGTPAAVLIMLIAGVLHIGLMGRQMSDSHREWWARLGGWLLIDSFCWLFLWLIAVYFPEGLGRLLNWEQAKASHPVTFTSVLVWVLSTAYGVFFGKSEHTSKWMPDVSTKEKMLGYLAKLTPYVFILGLLMGLSVLASCLANWITGMGEPTLRLPSDVSFDVRVPVLCALLFLAAVVLSWRVDINEFSTHYLYRNRLVRCYLGASVRERNAQPFTGFSDADNFPLGNLKIPRDSQERKDARPLPILNTSLNAVRGKELALQTRKARSFAFTPLYGGFTRQTPGTRNWEAFYAPTEKLASKLPGFNEGVTLGTTIAISGAAASPNMGSYSEPALAFLMTLFDVRLGWWVGNPKCKGSDPTGLHSRSAWLGTLLRRWTGSVPGTSWEHGSPRVGFYWLLRELLGATNDDSEFVYLSDGGHFENLAVYELVRRKCKLIVVGDASSDRDYEFGDLNNAIERCRMDFGVNIELDGLPELTPRAEAEDPQAKRSKAHFVTGKIRYKPESSEDDGTIIYLKPTLLKNDPEDVLAYAKKNESFPHDTTANQWFDEAHFENYRALGEAVGEAASTTIAEEIGSILK